MSTAVQKLKELNKRFNALCKEYEEALPTPPTADWQRRWDQLNEDMKEWRESYRIKEQ